MQNIVEEFSIRSKGLYLTEYKVREIITKYQFNEEPYEMTKKNNSNGISHWKCKQQPFSDCIPLCFVCRNISFLLSGSLTAENIMFPCVCVCVIKRCYGHTIRYVVILLQCAIFKGFINIKWMWKFWTCIHRRK